MTSHKFSWVVFNCWALFLLLFKAHGEGSGISLNFLKTPNSTTSLNSATFLFNVTVGGREVRPGEKGACACSHIICKLDYNNATDCGDKEASYTGLNDGEHKFEVCSVGSPVGCASYYWIVDTVPPTAHITAPASFTNAMNVSVNVSFTEACLSEDGKEGFQCSSVNACNLLVHGDGQVIPSSLVTLVPKRNYSILVDLSEYEKGNVTLEMDDNFCADSAGNRFIKATNSTFSVGFDRRSVLVNLSTPVPKTLVQLDTGNQTVLATNNYEDLKLQLNFSEPILNSSAEILKSMNASLGALVSIPEENFGNRTFGFKVVNVSSYAEITISFNTKSILTKLGNPVSPIEPVTFLLDSRRPTAELIAESNRTRQHIVPIEIKFSKPVRGITNSSILINGGKLLSLEEKNERVYLIEVQFDRALSVKVQENVTEDVLGNKNQACEALTVTHYSVPVISTVTSTFVTSTFAATSLATGLLTVSTAGLQSAGPGAFPVPPSFMMSNPAGNIFRSVGHIQVYALSRWLAITLPVEYYEFARSLQWSIPYFNLPWEKRHVQPPPERSKFQHSERFQNGQMKRGSGYKSTMDQGTKAETAFLDTQELEGWRDFKRSMIPLAVIGGSLIILHVLLILLLKYKRKIQWKYYGVIASPRFEICLLILALPCICKASAGLIKGCGMPSEDHKPEDKLGVAVGSVLLGVVASILLSIVLFLSLGVTLGKLLLYEALHQAGQKAHWYEHILGPGERGKWTWRKQSISVYMLLSPLVDDLRGPLKSQKHVGGSVTPADEKEDAEAPGRNPKDDDIVATADKKEEAKAPESKPNNGEITAVADETKEAEASWGSPNKHDEGIIVAADKKEEAKAPESCSIEDEITPATSESKETEAPGGNPQEHNTEITAAAAETKQAEATESNPDKDDDHNIASASATKVTETPGSNVPMDEDRTTFFDEEKLFGTLRVYYTLLQSVKQVTLGTLAGAYLHQRSNKSPSIILLSINSFQLLFLVILKPFVTKLVQLIEMISVACEIGMLTLCLVHFEDELSPEKESTRVTRRGITMIIFFLIGYIPQMILELYDLFRQIKHLDRSKSQSFLVGLKIANFGLLVILLPEQVMDFLENKFPDIKPAGGKSLRSKNSISGSVKEGAKFSKGSGTLALYQPSARTGSASVPPAPDLTLSKSCSFIAVASEIAKSIKDLGGRWCG